MWGLFILLWVRKLLELGYRLDNAVVMDKLWAKGTNYG